MNALTIEDCHICRTTAGRFTVFTARPGKDGTVLTPHSLDCPEMRALVLGRSVGPLVDPYTMPWDRRPVTSAPRRRRHVVTVDFPEWALA